MKRLFVVLAVFGLFGLAFLGCQTDQSTDPVVPTTDQAVQSIENPNEIIATYEKPVGPMKCCGKIGNFVWLDLDCDGIQDTHTMTNPEPGIPGVVVTLKDAAGNILATTVTDSLGRYAFRQVCEGSYYVEVTPPDGFDPTVVGATDPNKDSNENPAFVTLGVMEKNVTIDFGFCVRMGGGEGCTPGYWKQEQHFDSWPAPYTPNMLFSDVFEDAFPGMTLVQVASTGGGGLDALGRHTVSALLNSASDGVSYDLTTQEVIDMFNDVYPGTDDEYEALKDVFANFNEQNCPLN